MIRNIQNKVKDNFIKEPRTALNTTYSSAKIGNALTCSFTEGSEKTVMDMPKVAGGDGKGPTPGFHARAAIAGCVAIGVKQEAIHRQIKCKSIDVEIEMDFDDAAMFGLGDNTAAPLETRLVVKIECQEPAEKIKELVDRVLEIDPYFLALRDSQKVSAKVVVQ